MTKQLVTIFRPYRNRDTRLWVSIRSDRYIGHTPSIILNGRTSFRLNLNADRLYSQQEQLTICVTEIISTKKYQWLVSLACPIVDGVIRKHRKLSHPGFYQAFEICNTSIISVWNSLHQWQHWYNVGFETNICHNFIDLYTIRTC